MISALYVAILALIIFYTSLQVIKHRRKHQIKYNDGGVKALEIARSAHSNACEYIPIVSILLLALEYNQAPVLIVHLGGALFCLGRVLHCRAILNDRLKGRVLGMHLTLWPLLVMAIANFIFLPYSKILTF